MGNSSMALLTFRKACRNTGVTGFSSDTAQQQCSSSTPTQRFSEGLDDGDNGDDDDGDGGDGGDNGDDGGDDVMVMMVVML